MTACRYVVGYGYRLPAHELNCRDTTCAGCQPCTHENGNVVRHCTARQRCTSHLNDSEAKTCASCVGRARDNVDQILIYAWRVQEEALEAGVDSEAAMLAGPAADPAVAIWQHLRDVAALDQLPIEPNEHPETVLGAWAIKLSARYGLALPEPRPTDGLGAIQSTLGRSATRIDHLLSRAAQDEDFDFTELYVALAACRGHLENVLAEGRRPQRGAPCPACTEAPPLEKVYSHWCTSEFCKRQHDLSGRFDRWRCPACGAAASDADYRRWVSDDYLANADRLTAADIAEQYGIPAGTVRRWANEDAPRVKKRGYDGSGRQLYDVADVKKATAERKAPA